MIISPVGCFRTFFCVLVVMQLAVGRSFAQKPFVLPLQRHKLLYADTVYRQAVAAKDSFLLAEAYYLYGKTYEAAGDLLASHRWFLKSLGILEPLGDSFALSRLYYRMSMSECRQGHYQETRRYAQLSIAIARRIQSNQALSRAYSVMQRVYETDWSTGKTRKGPKPQPDSAFYYKQAGQTLLIHSKDSLALIERGIGIGEKLWYEKQDPGGIVYLKKALNLAVKKNEPIWQFKVIREMVAMYLSMDKPKQAWLMLHKADQLLSQSPFANSYGDQYNLEASYRDYYLKIGDWRRAYERSEKIHEMERNNYVSDRNGAVTRLGLVYETEKKEALLKAQQKELALRSENLLIQQRFLWAVLALLLLAFGTSIIFFRLYRRNQRISTRNAELVKEQNHRVKNNLQVVSSLLNMQANRLTDQTARKAVEESQLRIETMAILHRRLYDNDLLARIDLSEFIPELIDSVLQAFGYAYIQPIYELEPISLSADRALSLGLLLNELATNACKYAFPDHPKPAFRVSCCRETNRIRLSVADNGLGFVSPSPPDSLSKPRLSFGMRLIQMQVDQLRGTYQFASMGGTLFTLEFNDL
ncbi:histidine kinase dimerization/phosphoacceptor domain -containing protein [Spirosoma jeollabukense]